MLDYTGVLKSNKIINEVISLNEITNNIYTTSNGAFHLNSVVISTTQSGADMGGWVAETFSPEHAIHTKLGDVYGSIRFTTMPTSQVYITYQCVDTTSILSMVKKLSHAPITASWQTLFNKPTTSKSSTGQQTDGSTLVGFEEINALLLEIGITAKLPPGVHRYGKAALSSAISTIRKYPGKLGVEEKSLVGSEKDINGAMANLDALIKAPDRPNITDVFDGFIGVIDTTASSDDAVWHIDGISSVIHNGVTSQLMAGETLIYENLTDKIVIIQATSLSATESLAMQTKIDSAKRTCYRLDAILPAGGDFNTLVADMSKMDGFIVHPDINPITLPNEEYFASVLLTAKTAFGIAKVVVDTIWELPGHPTNLRLAIGDVIVNTWKNDVPVFTVISNIGFAKGTMELTDELAIALDDAKYTKSANTTLLASTSTIVDVVNKMHEKFVSMPLRAYTDLDDAKLLALDKQGADIISYTKDVHLTNLPSLTSQGVVSIDITLSDSDMLIFVPDKQAYMVYTKARELAKVFPIVLASVNILKHKAVLGTRMNDINALQRALGGTSPFTGVSYEDGLTIVNAY